MADDRHSLAERVQTLLQSKPWYRLPRLLAMGRLVEIRNQLRAENLLDTEEPRFTRDDPNSADPTLREAWTSDGTHNDLDTRECVLLAPASGATFRWSMCSLTLRIC